MATLAAASRSLRSLRTLLALVPLHCCLFANPAEARAGDPDAAVISLWGPAQAHAGVMTYVASDVWNANPSAWSGTCTLEVLLTHDEVLDGSDPLIATYAAPAFGVQNIFLTVPGTVNPGTWRWALRVQPLPGETDLADNVFFGTEVKVLATDLELEDPSPIAVFAPENSTTPVVASVTVENAGSSNGILVFSAAPLISAPWLFVDSGDGFALSGGPGATVHLHVDPTGLPAGTYNAIVRFQNYALADDHEDVSVTLTIGPPHVDFRARLRGQIGVAGETDVIHFDAVEGMRIRMHGKVAKGNLKLVATLIAPSGGIETVVQFKHPTKLLKKIVTAHESGEYSLIISGEGASTGTYALDLDRHNPPLAKAHQVNAGQPGGPGFVDLPLPMLKSARLDFSLLPNADFAGPVTVELRDGQGNVIDLAPFLSTDGEGNAIGEAYQADATDTYVLRVGGYGADPQASVKALLFPIQPAKTSTLVYLP